MPQHIDSASAALLALEEDMSSAAGELFVDLVAEYFAATRSRNGQVSTPRSADELAARFSDALPTHGRSLDAIVKRLAVDVIADANQLMHSMSLGHQVAAPLPAAVWSESLIGALNQSEAIWEMSPTATVIETQLVRGLSARRVLRVTVMNPRTTRAHLASLLDGLAREAHARDEQ